MVDKERVLTILNQSLKGISRFMEDPRVTEITVTGDGRVRVEQGGEFIDTGIDIPEIDRQMAMRAVAQYAATDGGSAKEIKSGTSSAILSLGVGGMRFAAALKGVDPSGTTLAIRKHRAPEDRPTLSQLVDWGMLSQENADLLVRLIVDDHLNCIFAGPTSGGKTTLANAVLMHLPINERIGIIEDAREMALKVPHKNQYLAIPEAGLTAKILVQLAMRERYDRLILSETRGDDTFDLLRALASGHNGSVTTLHASSAEGALSTLELLFQMSLPPGVQMSPQSAQRYIGSCINLIVYCSRRYVKADDGGLKSVRCVSEILLVKGAFNGQYDLQYLYRQPE